MKNWLVLTGLAMMLAHDPEQVGPLMVVFGACGLLTLLCTASAKGTVFHMDTA
jgi:hypothetical protein